MAEKLGKIVLFALAGLLLVLVIAYAARDSLATRATAYMMDRSGDMRCSHPNVHISSSLKLVTLSPFECEMFKPGPLKSMKADSDVFLHLDGFELTRIEVKQATMDQRDRDTSHVKSDTLGDLANVVGVRDGLVKGMLDASESFSPGGPVLHADTLIAKRNGKVESVMKDFRRTFEDGWERQHAARLEGGGGVVAMRDFDMRVTKQRGKLSLAVHLGKPERGENPDMKLKMEATGLDEETPRVSLSL
ncbi:MAG TPA: hypothetical protein VFN67_31735 [Polyangiales bacterium]|nr:hypothetical protein [Polyangiales bacterium]